jgi:hypothetical protein
VFHRWSAGFEKSRLLPITPHLLTAQTNYQPPIVRITAQMIFVGSNPEHDFTFFP